MNKNYGMQMHNNNNNNMLHAPDVKHSTDKLVVLVLVAVGYRDLLE